MGSDTFRVPSCTQVIYSNYLKPQVRHTLSVRWLPRITNTSGTNVARNRCEFTLYMGGDLLDFFSAEFRLDAWL